MSRFRRWLLKTSIGQYPVTHLEGMRQGARRNSRTGRPVSLVDEYGVRTHQSLAAVAESNKNGLTRR